MKLKALKGMHDILPPETKAWERAEAKARRIFGAYGFHEIRTPILEPTALFQRGVGSESELVQKQMYTFQDKKGKNMTLRPEETASVVRAYIEATLHTKDPVAKFFYNGPMFRYERPQKGRQRQFYQIGAELIGAESPLADAEILVLLQHFLDAVGVGKTTLEINSVGCKKCRPAYQKMLSDFLKKCLEDLCEDCQNRSRTNPLRILDCKKENCCNLFAGVPTMDSFWCEGCKNHYSEVKKLLTAAGLDFKENHRIVRGLDYYCRTAFEFLSDRLGAQDAVAAGGRYDGLVKELGGPDVPGVGFAIGMERLMLLADVACLTEGERTPVFFALLGNNAQEKGLVLAGGLRKKGIYTECGFEGSLKSQMRRAGKLNAGYTVIIGDNEVAIKAAQVKDMATGEQQEISFEKLAEHLS